MTVTAWLLLALAAATALGCMAFLLPPPLYTPPHPFETDPFLDQGEHIGRHELIEDGPTRRLNMPTMRHIPDQDQLS